MHIHATGDLRRTHLTVHRVDGEHVEVTLAQHHPHRATTITTTIPRTALLSMLDVQPEGPKKAELRRQLDEVNDVNMRLALELKEGKARHARRERALLDQLDDVRSVKDNLAQALERWDKRILELKAQVERQKKNAQGLLDAGRIHVREKDELRRELEIEHETVDNLTAALAEAIAQRDAANDVSKEREARQVERERTLLDEANDRCIDELRREIHEGNREREAAYKRIAALEEAAVTPPIRYMVGVTPQTLADVERRAEAAEQRATEAERALVTEREKYRGDVQRALAILTAAQSRLS